MEGHWWATGAGDQVLPSETLRGPTPLRVSVSLQGPSHMGAELGGDTLVSGVTAVHTRRRAWRQQEDPWCVSQGIRAGSGLVREPEAGG